MVGRHEIAERVVEATVSHADASLLELPCLYERLDPDALDTAVKTLANGAVSPIRRPHCDRRWWWSYHDYRSLSY